MEWTGWEEFLADFNRELVGIDDVREEVGLPREYDLPEDVELVEWLGFPGASEAELETLERRLGATLPPSYRDFLAASNGWQISGSGGVRVLPAAEVDWLRRVDPKLVKIWECIDRSPSLPDDESSTYDGRSDVHFRAEHIPGMLVISDAGWANDRYFCLNPAVIFRDGEWEAWDFATGSGHASRYRSFRELMAENLRHARVDRRHGG